MSQNLAQIINFYNPWWQAGKIDENIALPFLRPSFYEVASYLETDRIVIIKGPRRTGKSTTMFQLINWLLLKKVDPMSILFLSLDDPGLKNSLDEILNQYSQLTKRDFSKQQLYCLLDEAHALPNWQLMIKKFYDQKYPIKFVVSSSAASLLKTATESLAGRTIEKTILPFSFFEFISYYSARDAELNKHLLPVITKIKARPDWNILLKQKPLLPFERQIKIFWQMYIEQGGFPNLLNINDQITKKRLLREDIIDKAIYRDIVSLYGVKEPQMLEKIFLYCVSISGQLLNISNLSKSFGMPRVTLTNYLHYLEKSYLIFTGKKYAAAAESGLRAMEKVYVVDNGFFDVFQYDGHDEGVETIIAAQLLRHNSETFYWRDKTEVDFVQKIGRQLVPTEVKYTNEPPSVKNLAGLDEFKNKYKTDLAMVITKDHFEFKNNTWFIPAWLFTLIS